jgi:DNA-binding response OmpR family regulator
MIGCDRHLTILFAGGEVLVRNIVRTFLRENYDVLVAASGYEALELSRGYEGVIDILLSDVEMAGRDGLPLHWLVGVERPGIKILLTADGSRKPDHDGQLVPLLNKPFRLDTLHARLEELSEKDAGRDGEAKSARGVDGARLRSESEIPESIALSAQH